MATLYALTAALAEVLPLASWDNDDGGPGWVFGLVFWVAVIATVMLLIRSRGWFGPGPGSRDRESGTEILERRFAEGQLSPDEYRERRDVLEAARRDKRP